MMKATETTPMKPYPRTSRTAQNAIRNLVRCAEVYDELPEYMEESAIKTEGWYAGYTTFGLTRRICLVDGATVWVQQ